MKNIKFVKNTNEMIYTPEPIQDSFYQFCQFKNPHTNLFGSRKIIFNENGEILKKFEKEYNLKTINKFIQITKPNKYKIYPVYHISSVDYPNTSDMLQVYSSLIN